MIRKRPRLEQDERGEPGHRGGSGFQGCSVDVHNGFKGPCDKLDDIVDEGGFWYQDPENSVIASLSTVFQR